MKKIVLATDHAGFELKEKVKEWLLKNGYEVLDFGAFKYDSKDDYPDFISKAGEEISKNPQNLGIIFGGSGQGEAMMANRFKNVRATVFYGGPKEILKLSKEHKLLVKRGEKTKYIKAKNIKTTDLLVQLNKTKDLNE